jgi:hypothetical protein
MRVEWGCRKPTEQAQLWIPCVDCGGEQPGCKRCSGRGYEPIYSCPNVLVEASSHELLYLYRGWPQSLLVGGGVYDQPAGYVLAMRFIDAGVALQHQLDEGSK